MSVFTPIPISFFTQESTIVVPSFPPYNPFLYLDGSNASVGNATNAMMNVVTAGASNNFDRIPTDTVTWNSGGGYWQFNGSSYVCYSSTSTSNFVNAMGNREHTFISKILTTRINDGDFFGRFNQGSVFNMFFSDRFRTHVWNDSGLIVKDTSAAPATNVPIFIGSRFKNKGSDVGEVDVFLANDTTTPMTKTTGGDQTCFFGGNGNAEIRMGSARDGQFLIGRIYRWVLYDTALTDAQIEEVRQFMA
jgi:hypothetical protein